MKTGSKAGRRYRPPQGRRGPPGPPGQRRPTTQCKPEDPQCALCGTDGDCVPTSDTLHASRVCDFVNKNEEEARRYGNNGFGELVGCTTSTTGPGKSITRQPDIYKDIKGAQNSYAKKCGGEKTESCGVSKKTFTIQG